MCLEPVECKSKIFTKSKAQLFKKLPYDTFRLENVVIKFTLLLFYVVPVKSKVKISQIFVAFSEYMNFKAFSFVY